MSYSGAEWNTNGTTDTVEQNSTSYIGSQALEFIDEAELEEDVPWFAIVGFMAPHLPAIVEPAYDDAAVPPFRLTPAMRERDRRDKPAYVTRQRPPSLDDLESIRTRQLRSLVAVDDQIGRIMRRMSDLDELDDTLAIFVSDNGFLWGDHGLIGKSVPYDASIRVPLLARWPGHVRAGALDNRLVGMVDLAPTMMAAAHLSTSEKADGMNLLNAEASRHRLLIEFRRILPRHVPSWNAFLTHRFIFVSHRARVDGLVEREYYDMRTDPHQLHNLLGDKIRRNDPDVRLMMQRLRRLTTCAGRTCPR
jgi:arylsulfatase A-like enzyme